MACKAPNLCAKCRTRDAEFDRRMELETIVRQATAVLALPPISMEEDEGGLADDLIALKRRAVRRIEQAFDATSAPYAIGAPDPHVCVGRRSLRLSRVFKLERPGEPYDDAKHALVRTRDGDDFVADVPVDEMARRFNAAVLQVRGSADAPADE